ncbi:MAG TPA: YHYH protein [Roseimicrobium sp.]|nr:YHYH protein [Roseimicrobium sp.]
MFLAGIVLFAANARAHLIGEESHDHGTGRYDFTVKPPTTVLWRDSAEGRQGLLYVAATPASGQAVASSTGGPVALSDAAAKMAAPFAAFGPKVRTRSDDRYLYVESDGMPAHPMMIGITAWQQQIPLPQAYTGDNAWRVPLNPVPSKAPASIKGRFLRGAIALAVNGIPIFNPQNNRGEISQEIGELDQWGGHCGRADDYHYHAAPLHLQSVVGKGIPIAYALDGYPMYGLTEPDGSTPANLDSFNGHDTAGLGYHYHGSTKYPYVNGGFHGEVTEVGGQIDPQPRAQSVRQDQPPLRGAKITGFTVKDGNSYSLKYEVSGQTRYVNYVVNADKSVRVDFVDGSGQIKTETYTPRQGGGGPDGGNRPPSKDGQKRGPGGPRPSGDRADVRPDRNPGEPASVAAPLILTPKRTGNFFLTSSVVTNGGALPLEYTGDGAGISPPIEWKGAPAGTKSFAVVMDHLAPGNEMKCYWTVWDIPPTLTSLPKSAQGIGKKGAGFRGQIGYESPHSQGPGLKTYTITIYALSATPQISRPQREVSRDVLLTAIKDSILDSAELKVTYTRPGGSTSGQGERRGPGGPGNRPKGEQKQ